MSLDAAALRRWYNAVLGALTVNRRTVDELNVFPVPDGDTGTNMAATMRAACNGLEEAGPDASLSVAARMAARGALLGARGNSGVILAQMLGGFASAWDSEAVDAPSLADGLSRATASATDAVGAPTRGTILTVAEAAALAARESSPSGLPQCVREVSRAAAEALAATVSQLPALRRAGVVDAGGLGLALLCDALREVVTGDRPVEALRAARSGAGLARSDSREHVARESGSPQYAYEVQYLLDADVDAVEALRTRLCDLGDSVVIVGAASQADTSTWNVHAHVNDVGAAIESGIERGRLYRLSVTRFADEVPESPSQSRQRAVVVGASGEGLCELLRAEGAHPMPRNCRTADDIGVVLRGVDADEIVLLIEAVSLVAAEEAAATVRGPKRRVAVIPLRHPVQGLAALAVGDSARRFDDDVIAMAEAAGACRHAEVSVATRAALTSAGRCEPGYYLGLVDGDVIVIGAELSMVLCDLVDRLCGAGAELITVVCGRDLPDDQVAKLERHIDQRWPMVDMQNFSGGQQQLVWIGAE